MRIRHLQELLNNSEEQNKQKETILNHLKQQMDRISESEDIKKNADNTQYLKNVLLSYFEGRTDVKQTISIVSAVLKFTPEEENKVRQKQSAQSSISNVFNTKLWWQ